MATTSSSSRLIRTSRRALSYDGELKAHLHNQVAPDTFGPDHASRLGLEFSSLHWPKCHPRPRSPQQSSNRLQEQAKTWSNLNHVRYDLFDRRIGKSDTPAGGPTEVEVYVYDGAHVALRFIDGQLANRYLHGPAIDQILADEQVDSLSSPGEVLWPLTDHLGTVRDLASYDDTTDTTSVVNHIAYDAFGRVTSQSNAAIDHLFGYTGREWDSAVDLQYNRARWYDPAIGRWLSEDPIGFNAGDANLSRYVENRTTIWIDPFGLEPPTIGPLQPGVPQFQFQPWYQEYNRLRQLQQYYREQGGGLPFSEGSRLVALERRLQWELAVWRAEQNGYSWFDIICTMQLMPGGGIEQTLGIVPGATPSVDALPPRLPSTGR